MYFVILAIAIYAGAAVCCIKGRKYFRESEMAGIWVGTILIVFGLVLAVIATAVLLGTFAASSGT